MPTKVRLVKTMVFPVVIYGCESWTIKKSEHQRIDPFELWCWRRLLRVLWTARRSNQSILKEISPGCSLEDWCWRWKFQYFGHLMQRADSFEKTLMVGKLKGRRRRGRQRMIWLDGIIDSIGHEFGWTSRVGDRQEVLACCSSWGHRVGHDWATELNWTDSVFKTNLWQMMKSRYYTMMWNGRDYGESEMNHPPLTPKAGWSSSRVGDMYVVGLEGSPLLWAPSEKGNN